MFIYSYNLIINFNFLLLWLQSEKTQLLLNNSNNNNTPNNINNNNNSIKYDRNETLDHLKQDLHLYKKERDDAIYKFEQVISYI